MKISGHDLVYSVQPRRYYCLVEKPTRDWPCLEAHHSRALIGGSALELRHSRMQATSLAYRISIERIAASLRAACAAVAQANFESQYYKVIILDYLSLSPAYTFFNP